MQIQPDPGGSAGDEDLARLVYSRNPTVLARLLERSDLDESSLVLLLKNPALPRPAVERICREEIFFSSYQVQAAVVQNPRAPERVGLRYLPVLFWKDQLLVARDFRIRMVLRRKAERAIIDRLRKMALGEKLELARLATTEILNALVIERDARLLKACLENPRATEETALRLIHSTNVEPGFLVKLAQMPRWFALYGVKLELSRAELTPVPLVLRILPALKLEDLQLLARDKRQPEVVAKQAREIIGLKLEESSREE